MKHFISYVFIIFCLLFILSCEEKKDLLMGKWERFGDQMAGAVIRVDRVGVSFQGILLHVSGELELSGFVANDIKWNGVIKKDDESYEGQDLEKRQNTDGHVISSDYVPVRFRLLSDDILEVSSINDSPEKLGNVQKWKRIE